MEILIIYSLLALICFSMSAYHIFTIIQSKRKERLEKQTPVSKDINNG